MSAPASQILKGNWSAPVLTAEQLHDRADGLTAGTLTFMSLVREQFTRGQILSTHPGLAVQEARKQNVGGNKWQHDLDVLGIAGDAAIHRAGGFPNGPKASFDGWDEVRDEVYTSNASYASLGSRGFWLGLNGIYYCVSRDAQPVGYHPTLKKISLTFKGLAGFQKRLSRDYDTHSFTIAGDTLRWAYPGGWTNYTKGKATITYPVVTDTWLSINPPDTANDSNSQTPPSPPGIKYFQVYFNQKTTRYWPNLWIYTVTGSQPFGENVPLWLLKRKYTYQPPVLNDSQ